MRNSPAKIAAFRRAVWKYYRAHARSMPWRETRDPYAILISEIMLQQTQAGRVIPKYGAFLARFPDFASLATAPVRDVLAAWQGLGYNRRALYLKRAAERVMAVHNGALPEDPAILKTLPGIGPGTAGALAAFAFQKPAVFIETNIRRAFLHFFFPKPKKTKPRNNGAMIGTGISDKEILALVRRAVSRRNPREWYYALMDYGAMLGKRNGVPNPNRRSRHYGVQSRFEGSQRQLRGRVLAALLADPALTTARLAKQMDVPAKKIKQIRAVLAAEGLL